ncbi:MarR family winged helix-turn-helix transcriptional regulator [bacterium]|nr:MarR family winged helix-turn-helix transcriptional regulator [bacterium]MBU1884805.1 MarR family winged helix-turn-helix transcriptional regulator [bacterium]
MVYMLKDSIGYRINLVATTIKTNFTKLLQAECGIAAEQYATLKIISEDNEVTQTRIAELLGKDKTTIGRSIESLLKKGLLFIEDVESDRRANRVSLTPKAEEILKSAIPMALKFNETVKSKLTKNEVEIFFKVLDIILEESKNMKRSKGENR